MPPYHPPKRSWPGKFADAARGIKQGVVGQSSFAVHLVFTIAVTICGVVFRVSRLEWCLLILCIALVLAAEAANSAIETLAPAIRDEHDERIGAALDIASGAVLIASLGAAAVGAIIFVYRLGVMLAWW